MKKFNYKKFSTIIYYDPKNELFYCGIPIYNHPTICQGGDITKITEKFESLIDQYEDYKNECLQDGEMFTECLSTQIEYNIHEGYSSGWLIGSTEELKSLNQDSNINYTTLELLNKKKLKMQNDLLISELRKNHEEFDKKLKKTEQKSADARSKCQILKQQLINSIESDKKNANKNKFYFSIAKVYLIKITRIEV